MAIKCLYVGDLTLRSVDWWAVRGEAEPWLLAFQAQQLGGWWCHLAGWLTLEEGQVEFKAFVRHAGGDVG